MSERVKEPVDTVTGFDGELNEVFVIFELLGRMKTILLFFTIF